MSGSGAALGAFRAEDASPGPATGVVGDRSGRALIRRGSDGAGSRSNCGTGRRGIRGFGSNAARCARRTARSMIGALVCLAVAVLIAPVSRSRRRFTGMFVAAGVHRKMQRGSVFRAAFAVGMVAALAIGVAPLLAAVLVGGTVGIRVRRGSRDRRRGVECARLLDALEAVIGELRVGAHPSAAAEVAAQESRGEAARVFAVCAARSRLGGSGADGLRHTDSIVDAELGRIADAWQVAENHGLALAELLSAARTDVSGRIRFRARTTAALAGARATAAVLAGLPLLGIGLGQLMGAAPLHVLLSPGAGTALLPLGAALACIGLLWTDAITRKVLL